jgi:hypothetical protein
MHFSSLPYALLTHSLPPFTIPSLIYRLKQTPRPQSASELYRPSDRSLSAKLVPTFADRGCHVLSTKDPYGRILGFVDRSRYFFFQVASQFVLTRLSGPRSRPTTSQKIWQRRESNPDPWICSHKLTTRPQRLSDNIR